MTYRNFKEWFSAAEAAGAPLARVVLENEMLLGGKTEADIYSELTTRWEVMRASAQNALDTPGVMPGGLISGQAKRQEDYAAQNGGYSGSAVNHMMARALSASEVNASMGRICAAPTAGACGVLPAVLLAALEKTGATHRQLQDALLVAAGVGAIITKNASIAGAEGGCQAECGAAAAMAAAAAVVLAGGSNVMAGHAVSIALMNCMGLVCDPVAGLVQLPCSFRNASQAANALISADMALAGQNAVIPADEAVDAMYRVGRMLPTALRETAEGGIATTPTGKKIKKDLLPDM